MCKITTSVIGKEFVPQMYRGWKYAVFTRKGNYWRCTGALSTQVDAWSNAMYIASSYDVDEVRVSEVIR